eukprot:CAMPEP_0202067936 /NCGR_PEP_ID=MMETSP0963-20130614/54730_1 /ASSEMBLY_ACC=CAM_ASM_000494 /TAXON_ID=4773 /ORGANISM="Schizochytrium aggregatum, Strain ATCC28209" /LENGTH=113 /DNA_ID=CAMNT_0048634653 /DNA_START=681 /DNA_END=1023 /DNA_ORIENTATION=-
MIDASEVTGPVQSESNRPHPTADPEQDHSRQRDIPFFQVHFLKDKEAVCEWGVDDQYGSYVDVLFTAMPASHTTTVATRSATAALASGTRSPSPSVGTLMMEATATPAAPATA